MELFSLPGILVGGVLLSIFILLLIAFCVSMTKEQTKLEENGTIGQNSGTL